MRVSNVVFVFILYFITTLASSNEVNKNYGTSFMSEGKCDFSTIELNSFEPSNCSPILEFGSYGIVINNPKLINNNFVIPICGSWQFDAKFISQFKDISNEIIVVVNDLNGKKSYSSNLLLDEFSSPESDDLSEGNSNAIKPSIVSGWFNIDLYRYLSDLPKKNTKLVVYATIGNFKSNVTEIEVSVK